MSLKGVAVQSKVCLKCGLIAAVDDYYYFKIGFENHVCEPQESVTDLQVELNAWKKEAEILVLENNKLKIQLKSLTKKKNNKSKGE